MFTDLHDLAWQVSSMTNGSGGNETPHPAERCKAVFPSILPMTAPQRNAADRSDTGSQHVVKPIAHHLLKLTQHDGHNATERGLRMEGSLNAEVIGRKSGRMLKSSPFKR